MSNESLKKRLLDLATSSDRAKFQRIRDVFPEIEAALAGGATRAQIVEALKAEGIDIDPKVFTNYVARLRAQRDKEADRQARSSNTPHPPHAAERPVARQAATPGGEQRTPKVTKKENAQ